MTVKNRDASTGTLYDDGRKNAVEKGEDIYN